MNPAGARVDQRGKRIQVGGNQFPEGPVFQHQPHEGMAVFQFREGLLVSGIIPAGALFGFGIERQLLENDLAHLSGRGEVQQRIFRQRTRLLLDLRQLDAQCGGIIAQRLRIHPHAGMLHVGKHLDQRHFHLSIEVPEVLFPQFQAQQRSQRIERHRLPAGARKILRRSVHGSGYRGGEKIEGRLGRSLFHRSGSGRTRIEVDIQVGIAQNLEFVRPLGIEQVVHQLRIVQFAVQFDAVLQKEEQRALEVEPALDDRLIRHQAAEFQGCRIQYGILLVAGHYGPGRFEIHRSAQDGDRTATSGSCRGEHRLRRLLPTIHRRFGRGLPGGNLSFRGRKQSLERIEFKVVEELRHGSIIPSPQTQRRFVILEADIRADGGQRLAQADIGLRRAERLLHARRQFGDVGVDVLHGAILRDQFPGADLSHAGHALDVVGGVAPDGENVDDMLGIRDAVGLAQARLVEDLGLTAAFSGFVLVDMVVDNLPQVLVRGHHVNVKAPQRLSRCHRPDHVVRLESRLHQHGNLQRFENLLQGLQRGMYQLGRGGAVGLVIGTQLMAESLGVRIEHHGQVGGLFPADQLQEEFRKTEQNGGILPFRIDHGTPQECIIHPENQRMTIYEKKPVHRKSFILQI